MKQCKQGYYYCYTDKKCKRIPLGYRVASGGYIRKENENSSDNNENDSNNSNGNGNGGNGSGSGNGGSNGGGMSEGSLHKWFKGSKSKDGKGGWVNVVTGGTCASDEPGEGTPKCVSSSKRASMTKAERKSAARRKKTKDPGQQQKSGAAKPTYVSTDKKKMKKEEVEIIEAKDKKSKGSGKKDACYHKVKSRYSVWPSAYASGALVKCRKKGAANWGNKSESVEFFSWRDDFQATEYEFIDIIKAQPLVSEGAMPDAIDPKAHMKAQKGQKVRNMTKSPNENEANVARKMSKGPSLPMEEVETVEEGQKCWKGYKKKGTKKMFGKTYNNCVKENEEVEIEEKAKNCWDTHKKVGMKMKGGKLVNNCVKKEEFVDEAKDDTDIGEKTGKKVPRKNISDANRHKMEKRRRENLKKRPGDAPGDSKLIQALRSKAKETGNYAEEKEESKVGGGNLKKLTAKAVRRVDADVDGDVDSVDMKSSETGVFVPSPDGKKLKPKVRFEGASDWRNELDEGWKSALAGAGVAAALMSQGGQKAPDKKTTTSPSRSNTERVSKTTQKKLSPMDQWREKHPKLAKKSDNPPKFKRKKLSPINKDWAKEHRKLADDEKSNRSNFGEGAAWTKKSGKNKSGGLNEKGRKSYERENPGSDLKAPSKKVGNSRRKSFCARMKGMRKRQKPSNNTGDDRLSKSLRAWNC